jgi:hypothetical protein
MSITGPMNGEGSSNGAPMMIRPASRFSSSSA